MGSLPEMAALAKDFIALGEEFERPIRFAKTLLMRASSTLVLVSENVPAVATPSDMSHFPAASMLHH
jgi:hypothetical protein